MRHKRNAIKYCFIILFLSITSDMLSQKISVDNTIIVDTTLMDEDHKIIR